MQSLDMALMKCYEQDLDWSLLPARIREVRTFINCIYLYYTRPLKQSVSVEELSVVIAPRKFEVFKPTICVRSEASRTNIIVLKQQISNGNYRSTVPKHTHSIAYIVYL